MKQVCPELMYINDEHLEEKFEILCVLHISSFMNNFIEQTIHC